MTLNSCWTSEWRITISCNTIQLQEGSIHLVQTLTDNTACELQDIPIIGCSSYCFWLASDFGLQKKDWREDHASLLDKLVFLITAWQPNPILAEVQGCSGDKMTTPPKIRIRLIRIRMPTLPLPCFKTQVVSRDLLGSASATHQVQHQGDSGQVYQAGKGSGYGSSVCCWFHPCCPAFLNPGTPSSPSFTIPALP